MKFLNSVLHFTDEKLCSFIKKNWVTNINIFFSRLNENTGLIRYQENETDKVTF